MTSKVRARAASMEWQITKRDGRVEPFDPEKITSAVAKCFINGLKAGEADANARGREIRTRVVNSLKGSSPERLTVEDMQRLVLQQLWAAGHFEAAEHYTLYREERRKQRQQRPVSPAETEAIMADVAHFGSDLRYYQFLSKYARWRDDKGRRETWRECVDRVMQFFRTRPQLQSISSQIWQELDDGLYKHQSACSSRILQMAGPALERCNTGAYNCAYQDIDCLEAFAELLYILMQGTGEGFSVESVCVDQLPRIRKQRKPAVVHMFVIPDSTEGWCDALLFGLRAWYAGEDVNYDYSLIRLAGARLKTKGGRASGPDPLRRLLTFTREKILASQGSRLADIDAHDICCMIGKIVQVGGVRRAAEISISDLDSDAMRFAKHGAWWDKAPMRDMANNSAAYDEKPDAVTFMREWLSLAESGSGERGIFNRVAVANSIPKRRKRVRFGVNPCGEIILRSAQFCVAGDTPLITREGLVRIEETVGQAIEVWNGVSWSEVTPFQTGTNQQLVRVTFSDGSYLDCTPDHRFSVSTTDDRFNGRPWREVPAKDLKPKMATETFRIQHTAGSVYKGAYTLGVLFGDGHFERGQMRVDLYGPKQFLPIEGERRPAVLKPNYNVPCVRADCGEQHVKMVESLRADREETWRTLFSWDRESILRFLAGIADTDGSNTESGTVRIYVAGRDKAAWIQLLLTKCGIRSSVNLHQLTGEETNYGLRHQDSWYVQITECRELPCHRLETSGGHEATMKGKFQTVRSVEYLPGLHDSFCFTEPKEHKGVFNNTLTYQCNLSIVVARFGDTEVTLRHKVRLAAIWGTLQSTLTDFRYIRSIWKENCEEERLLGVDITGQMDCPLLRPSNPDRARLLRSLYQLVEETNAEFSQILGIGLSAAMTCVKPSGNSAEFYGCSSGVSTRYAKHKIRRFRAGRPEADPLSKFLADQGVPWNPDPMNESLVVFDFIPEPAPEGTPCRNDMTALEQLENWLCWKQNWADHSVSCTIHVEPHEWLSVGHWVYSHFEHATSLAFLPKDGGSYQLMPNQEITKEEYQKLREAFPVIDWSKLPSYESDDRTTSSQEYACTGGTCELP